MPTHPASPSEETLDVWFNQAEQARLAGELDMARTLLDRVIGQDPGHADALHTHGLVALASNQLESAQSWVERALEVRSHPAYYGTLCIIQIKLRAYASALQTAECGLALEPAALPLCFFMAVILQVLGRSEDAAVVYRRLLELRPDHPQALANLGVVFKDLGSLYEAERHLSQAIALAPSYLGARASLSQVLLAAGRNEEAWPYFEDRWANFVDADGRPVSARPTLPLPQWRGERLDIPSASQGAPAYGARLLVIPEQGHGDSLQFVRYLPMALERFARVGYICPPSLRRLYEESFAHLPDLVMLDDGLSDLSDWDWHCPLMSLPMAFGTRLDNIPAGAYLHADAARSASWRARLALLPDAGLPRVGLVWAGGHSGLTEDRARSLTPAQIAPLLALPDVRWISLQKTDDPAKRADATCNARLTDWMDDVTDFADTAALIDNLDLVICVDTSVAHLAAAMGKPVWLLNRFAGCWRWLRDRDDSPWYASARLFTQSQRGDWDGVLERVADALHSSTGRKL
ncbi:tetratricopeptide repeat protein [Paraburkholderia sp. BL6665CI2N2]|nr:glycosyltransferase family 9 protein [Paraburkholderia sp. BL6665CI2N2]TDY22793.1 tetratricopeptide repeat protein [Paraburkholderia sp. BL6665CI2N2]